jgi:anti-sigma factor RsiW
VDCLPVRERLAEHALSNLAPDERAFVERHLQWCAGCRKEAAELVSAAAVAGKALPQADPPAELEDRVVRAVRAAAGARPRRRRVRAVAVLVAATLAVLGLGVGWGASVVQNAKHREHQAVVQAHQFAARLHGLISDVVPRRQAQVGPRDHLREAQLAPALPNRVGGGSAAVFLSPVRQDWALVVVGGLSPRGAPFRVSMRDQYGKFAYVGTVKKLDSAGDASVWHEYEQHLDGFTDVIVKDRTGRIVLSGTIAPTPVATATP